MEKAMRGRRVIRRRREEYLKRGVSNWELHGATEKRRRPGRDVGGDEGEGSGADIEIERSQDLEDRTEHRGERGVGDDDDRALVTTARKAIVLAPAVEDETIQKGGGRRGGGEPEGEDGVVDGGTARSGGMMVLRHGIREG